MKNQTTGYQEAQISGFGEHEKTPVYYKRSQL